MHHEDRAGVNALIRAIDDLARARIPVATVMATNRLDAIDPAIRRRAANVWPFERPTDEQRRSLLHKLFPSLGKDPQLEAIVKATGPSNGVPYGFTYSDIAQRLAPAAILEAFRDGQPLDVARVIAVAASLKPTPPFGHK